MAAVNVGLFQTIRSVGWSTGPNHILAIRLNANINYGGPSIPTPAFNLNILGSNLAEKKITIIRPGVKGPHPTIQQHVTDAMLQHYIAWSYAPYSLQDAVTQSSGGGFWSITVHESGPTPIGKLSGVLSDWIAAPYGSLGEAETYIDGQVALHPAAYGNKFFLIAFQPFQLFFSTSKVWRNLLFINLKAVPRANNQWKIPFTLSAPGAAGGSWTMEAKLFIATRASDFIFEADGTNIPTNFQPDFVANYIFHSGNNANVAIPGLGGVMIVHDIPRNHNQDFITGPISPSGPELG